MNRVIACLLFGAGLLCSQAPTPRKAPELAIQTGPDKYMWLSQSEGKTVVVAVIMTTCPHCQYTTGVLSKIQKEYAAKGVQIMATAIEPMSSLNIEGFKKQFQPAFPVGYNDQKYVMKFLGLPENDPMFVPQLVFIDKSGTIRAQLTGDSPEMEKAVQEKKLRELLDKVLSGK